MPRSSSKKSKAKELDDDMYDEVDTYHRERDEIKLASTGQQQSDSSADSSSEEDVMSISGNKNNYYDSSDSDSDSADDSDIEGFNAPPPPRMEDSDHDDIMENEEGGHGKSNKEDTTSGWGKKSRAFYGDDDVDRDAHKINPDSSEVSLQQKEARKLQSKRRSRTEVEDYALSDSSNSSSEDERDEQDEKITTKSTTKKSNDSSSESEQEEEITRDHTTMSVEDKLAVVVKDSPELLGLLADMKEKAEELKKQIQPMHEAIKTQPTSAGVSFLEVKLHLLLNYIMNGKQIHIYIYVLQQEEVFY